MEDVRRGRARFEAALRADPDSVVALTGLGAALMSERFGHSGEPPPEDVAASERVAARALAIAPNNSVALINWANVLLFRGQPDLALPCLTRRRCCVRHPTRTRACGMPTALQLKGRAAEMQPHIDSAMRMAYRDSRDHGRRPASWLGRSIHTGRRRQGLCAGTTLLGGGPTSASPMPRRRRSTRCTAARQRCKRTWRSTAG